VLFTASPPFHEADSSHTDARIFFFKDSLIFFLSREFPAARLKNHNPLPAILSFFSFFLSFGCIRFWRGLDEGV